MPTSFSVANINPGVIRAEFMQSIRALDAKPWDDHLEIHFDQFHEHTAGPYLDDERNRCVEWFLNETESDYLLFVDSDIAFTPDQAHSLIAAAAKHSLQLVGGVYYSCFPQGVYPVVYLWQHDQSLDARNLLSIPGHLLNRQAEIVRDGIVSVDAFGTGFMAVHRDLFLSLAKKFSRPTPYFAECVVNGVHMGEDMTFCIRAADPDIAVQPYVIPAIQVDHYKAAILRPPAPPSQLTEDDD